MNAIDSAWFYEKLAEKGASSRDMARFMSLHPSAVSRMLNGERKMSAEEQDQVAVFLGIGLDEIAAHRRGETVGFSEEKQAGYGVGPMLPDPSIRMFTEDEIIYENGKRLMEMENGRLIELHPIFGCMKGTITVLPGVDLTAPMDWEEDWGETLYNE